jgi:hypothetical protein
VFVDESGRRAHRVHLAGVAMAAVCACWLGMLVFGMSGFTALPGSHLSVLARVISVHRPILDIDRTAGATEPVGTHGRWRAHDTYLLDRGSRQASCEAYALSSARSTVRASELAARGAREVGSRTGDRSGCPGGLAVHTRRASAPRIV